MSAGTQHHCVWHATADFLDNSIEAAYLWQVCRGAGFRSSWHGFCSQSSEPELSMLVIAPDVNFIVLNWAGKLLALCLGYASLGHLALPDNPLDLALSVHAVEIIAYLVILYHTILILVPGRGLPLLFLRHRLVASPLSAFLVLLRPLQGFVYEVSSRGLCLASNHFIILNFFKAIFKVVLVDMGNLEVLVLPLVEYFRLKLAISEVLFKIVHSLLIEEWPIFIVKLLSWGCRPLIDIPMRLWGGNVIRHYLKFLKFK